MALKQYISLFASLFGSFAFKAQTPNNLPPIQSLTPDVQYRLQYDWAWLNRYRADNQAIISNKTDTTRVVFLGDSITEGWSDAVPTFFEEHLNYINRGIGGQTTGQVLLRFRNDVLALKPSKVAIMIGINDIAENNGAYREEETFGNIVSMLEIAKANNLKVILCSITPANQFVWRRDIKEVGQKIVSLNELLKKYAAKHQIPYCNYHAELVDNQFGTKKEFTTDGVHLTEKGYTTLIKTIRPFLK